MKFIKFFNQITLADLPQVGGKNASLGQMTQALTQRGIRIPNGFAITADAYWEHIKRNNLIAHMRELFGQLSEKQDLPTLEQVGSALRAMITEAPLPHDIAKEITEAYIYLCHEYRQEQCDVAIRSSATAEDLPTASFAGQLETFLHIEGIEQVLIAYKKCIASLFTDRAIIYRQEHNFDHFTVAVSVGIQKMVHSDTGSSGVAFSLDPDTGFKDVVVINSSYGLGETIVQGIVNPDEFYVYKLTLAQGFKPIIKKQLGSKTVKLVYAGSNSGALIQEPVVVESQLKFSLTDTEILELARQVTLIEDYYTGLKGRWSPMDIEWALDGQDGLLYIVQARPETIYGARAEKQEHVGIYYKLEDARKPKPKPIVTGSSIGRKIAQGIARKAQSIHDIEVFNEGDILITSMTNPDWVPIMKKAGGIVTDRGGRTSHAAIVSRELGVPALVGTEDATARIANGQKITLDCSQGSLGAVYDGFISFTKQSVTIEQLPASPVQLMMNLADPARAFELSELPVDGVGLARLEFIIASSLKIHPLAVCNTQAVRDPAIISSINTRAEAYNNNPEEFYSNVLAQAVGMIAAAFYPRLVIVRLTDFKSNEYRNLLGGEFFEHYEENPMLGFRGALRYTNKQYAPAFALECQALKKVRDDMGFTNVAIMIPFVRTIQEAQDTIQALQQHGLKRHVSNLTLFMMVELPANVLLLEDFCPLFDGFSIGSNDLTQLTLGIDRDAGLQGYLLDERNPAVKKMLKLALEAAQRCDRYISICGEAPSDFPELAQFLIDHGINALSLNADVIIPFLLAQEKTNNI